MSVFRGNGINVLISAPFSALEFYFYEVYKNNLYSGVAKQDLTFFQKMICGGFTGMTAATILYPLDVLKTFTVTNVGETKKSLWR